MCFCLLFEKKSEPVLGIREALHLFFAVFGTLLANAMLEWFHFQVLFLNDSLEGGQSMIVRANFSNESICFCSTSHKDHKTLLVFSCYYEFIVGHDFIQKNVSQSVTRCLDQQFLVFSLIAESCSAGPPVHGNNTQYSPCTSGKWKRISIWRIAIFNLYHSATNTAGSI